MEAYPSILVLGLGNPLRGDDGVGPRLVEELTRRGLPRGVTALDGGSAGLDLLQMLEGWQRDESMWSKRRTFQVFQD